MRRRVRHLAVLTFRVVVTTVVVLGLWQILYAIGALRHSAFPSATSMVAGLWTLLGTHQFWSEVGFTLGAWAWGLGMGAVAGAVLGVLIGLSRFAYRSLNLTIEFLKTIPIVAALPLAILLFGTHMKMNAMLVALGVIWPVMIQAAYGVRSLSPVVRETATVYHMRWHDRLLHTVIPSAMPSIATGLRLAATIALLLVVVAELIGGGGGLGYGIFQAENDGYLNQMYANVVVVGILGVVIASLFTGVERRALRWHPSYRAQAR